MLFSTPDWHSALLQPSSPAVSGPAGLRTHSPQGYRCKLGAFCGVYSPWCLGCGLRALRVVHSPQGLGCELEAFFTTLEAGWGGGWSGCCWRIPQMATECLFFSLFLFEKFLLLNPAAPYKEGPVLSHTPTLQLDQEL